MSNSRRSFLIRCSGSLTLLVLGALAPARLGAASKELCLPMPGKPSDLRIFELANPSRIVIDIYSSSLAQVQEQVKKWPELFTHGLYSRVAQNSPDKVRIVIQQIEVSKARIAAWKHNEKENCLILPVSPNAHASKVFEVEPVPTHPPLVIVLDPGHGGVDPGAVAKLSDGRQVLEKDIVLKLALYLQTELLEKTNFKVHLTRSTDKALSLRQRVQFARNLKADVMLSLHADSVPSKTPKGASLFVLSEGRASSEFGRILADSQNKVDFLFDLDKPQDPYLERTLLSLAQSGTSMESKKLAKRLFSVLKQSVNFHSKTINEASFAVLTAPDVPSVLVEAGFMSNPSDLANLVDETYLKQLASYISKGLINYCEELKKASNP